MKPRCIHGTEFRTTSCGEWIHQEIDAEFATLAAQDIAKNGPGEYCRLCVEARGYRKKGAVKRRVRRRKGCPCHKPKRGSTTVAICGECLAFSDGLVQAARLASAQAGQARKLANDPSEGPDRKTWDKLSLRFATHAAKLRDLAHEEDA